jgi:hypothetical protein
VQSEPLLDEFAVLVENDGGDLVPVLGRRMASMLFCSESRKSRAA